MLHEHVWSVHRLHKFLKSWGKNAKKNLWPPKNPSYFIRYGQALGSPFTFPWAPAGFTMTFPSMAHLMSCQVEESKCWGIFKMLPKQYKRVALVFLYHTNFIQLLRWLCHESSPQDNPPPISTQSGFSALPASGVKRDAWRFQVGKLHWGIPEWMLSFDTWY